MGKLRRIALVAVLAIVSSALLPYVHGATRHVGECGVCSALSHAGARVADTTAPPVLPAARVCIAVEEVASVPLPPRRDFAPRSARAPPTASVPA